MNCEAYSSCEGVSFNHRIVTAKTRLSLRHNATQTTTNIHYDWALLNNKDIRDNYVSAIRKKFDALQEKTEIIPRMMNMRISSTPTLMQQQNTMQ